VTLTKTLFRKEITIKLQGLTSDEREIASQKIAAEVIQREIFIKSKNIACYIPLEHEVNVWSVIRSVWNHGKNCYIPAFPSSTENYLCFVKFEQHDPLFKAKYNILVPEIVPSKIIAPEDLDLVIVPLHGFNSSLFRLGHGVGNYDRTFAFKKSSSSFRPYLLGVAYKCQEASFEPDMWDVKLDEVITV